MTSLGEELPAPDTEAPQILSAIDGKTVPAGQSATFTVVASGSNLQYQWFKGAAAITGATDPTLIIMNTSMQDAGSYSVNVENTLGTVTGQTLLTVQAPPAEPPPAGQPPPVVNTAPAIINAPTNQYAINGRTNAAFSVNASGTGPLTYQWYFRSDSGAAEIAIPGATTNLYQIRPARLGNAGVYRVVVTNAYGTATASARLDVETIDLR